jgi:hypothetical protein
VIDDHATDGRKGFTRAMPDQSFTLLQQTRRAYTREEGVAPLDPGVKARRPGGRENSARSVHVLSRANDDPQKSLGLQTAWPAKFFEVRKSLENVMSRLFASLFALCLLAFVSPAHALDACPYPFTAGAPCTAVTASATGTTAAVTATLPASATGKTTYICSFQIGANATAAASVPATVTGAVSGTLNYLEPVTVGAAQPLIVSFNPCVPASAINTPIAVNAGAAGTGGATSVTATGYQL